MNTSERGSLFRRKARKASQEEGKEEKGKHGHQGHKESYVANALGEAASISVPWVP